MKAQGVGVAKRLLLGFSIFAISACSQGFRASQSELSSIDNSAGLQTVCAPNSQQACQIANGIGSQTCNVSGNAWGACGNLTGCNSGFSFQNGQCVVNPSFYMQATSQPFKIADAQAGGFGYAYGPAIIFTQGIYHAYFCSAGTGASWDYIRHMTSTDLVNWSSPTILLTPNALERSNCDPSVVLYDAGDGPYYYLFYSGNVVNIQTMNFVARSSSPNGPFLKYTDRKTWEANPSDVHAITWPFKAASENSNIYGAGEPSVVVKDGTLYMWYTDSDQSGMPQGIYLTQSQDAVHWSAPVFTGVFDVSSDVKFDSASGLFVMAEVTPQISMTVELLIRTSQDGVNWSAPRTILDQNSFPHNSSNVGISGDDQGHLLPGSQILVGFGAPYNLNASPEVWGQWDLFGQLFDLTLTLANPIVFNPSWYLSHYPDLQAEFGNDTVAATHHWLNNGISEGRQGVPSFHSQQYLQMYSDLAVAFGSANYAAGIQHYLTYGTKEGRAGVCALRNEVFDAAWYLQKYPDLQAAFGGDLYSATQHWLNNGIYEGRQAGPMYWSVDYLNRYPDLTAAFGSTGYYSATEHYILYGISGGRNGQ
jgi:hypothetical protein